MKDVVSDKRIEKAVLREKSKKEIYMCRTCGDLWQWVPGKRYFRTLEEGIPEKYAPCPACCESSKNAAKIHLTRCLHRSFPDMGVFLATELD